MATSSTGPNTPSMVRTIFPIAVALLVSKGITGIPGLDDTGLNIIVAAVLTWLYYFVVRVLERFSSTKWGWLLGYASAPTYAEPPARL